MSIDFKDLIIDSINQISRHYKFINENESEIFSKVNPSDKIIWIWRTFPGFINIFFNILNIRVIRQSSWNLLNKDQGNIQLKWIAWETIFKIFTDNKIIEE